MNADLDHRPLGDDGLESSLRDAFARGADTLPHTVDPWTRTTTAVRRSQVRRRTALVGAAALVAVAGVVGSLGGIPGLQADRPTVARRPDADVVVTTDDLSRWPLRGDLAKDKAFVAAANRELARQGTAAHLLFAGRVGDRRVGVGVVDALQDDGTTTKAAVGAVVEPVDATPGEAWEPVGFPGVTVDGQVSLGLQGRDGRAGLLVLARTDVSYVAYSRAASYDAKGRPSRTYTRMPVQDGVATATLDPGPLTSTSVLVGRDGSPGTPGELQLFSSEVRAEQPDPAVYAQAAADPRCTGSYGPMDVQNATEDVWDNRDPMNAPASIRAIWCRDVRGGNVGLFEITLADGTTFQNEMQQAVRKGGVSIVKGVGRPVARGGGLTTPAVLADLPEEGAVAGARYFVHAPGATRVEVVVGTGAARAVLLTARPDRDGFTELRLTDAQAARVSGDSDARVVLRDAAGRQVATVPLTDAVQDLRLDYDVPGPVR